MPGPRKASGLVFKNVLAHGFGLGVQKGPLEKRRSNDAGLAALTSAPWPWRAAATRGRCPIDIPPPLNPKLRRVDLISKVQALELAPDLLRVLERAFLAINAALRYGATLPKGSKDPNKRVLGPRYH